MKKIPVVLILLITALTCRVHMASPLRTSSRESTVFSSKHIDILREQIHIAAGKDFKTAFYTVAYLIQTEQEGRQIPLLFLQRITARDLQ